MNDQTTTIPDEAVETVPVPDNDTDTDNPVTEPDNTTAAEDAEETPVENPAEPESDPQPDIEALIAEAENRGYMRGRNERIAELMREPQLYGRQPPCGSNDRIIPREDAEFESEPMILNNPRISIWDR
ncbi:MAG: hypothetical protein K2L97_02680 [Muribaculaceae bacterium]|nr:hypothetical protein [Muribaculaceae bacterium]